VTARLDRRLDDAWQIFVFSTHGTDRFLLLDYRGSFGVGPWYDIKGESTRHGLSLAATYQFET
jgi:hypothetical protein